MAKTMLNKEEPSEVEELVKEKITIAQKLGIWDGITPVANYQDFPEYARFKEIDKRLWELVKS